MSALTIRLDEDQLAELARLVAAELRADTPPSDEWLDSTAAAEYVGNHPVTLRKAVAAGELDSAQDGPGCKRYFQRSELDRWRRSRGAPLRAAR